MGKCCLSSDTPPNPPQPRIYTIWSWGSIAPQPTLWWCKSLPGGDTVHPREGLSEIVENPFLSVRTLKAIFFIAGLLHLWIISLFRHLKVYQTFSGLWSTRGLWPPISHVSPVKMNRDHSISALLDRFSRCWWGGSTYRGRRPLCRIRRWIDCR